jgi:hypothetical protein
MFFHGSKMESLHKHIDPAYLPEDYGGKLPKINYSSVDWYPVLRTLDEDFKGKKENTFIVMTGLVISDLETSKRGGLGHIWAVAPQERKKD